MVSIFGLDLVDGLQIWLHVLYIFGVTCEDPRGSTYLAIAEAQG